MIAEWLHRAVFLEKAYVRIVLAGRNQYNRKSESGSNE